MLPCTSISSPRAGLAMEHVDVLGDHRVQQAALLERHERAVGAVGQLRAERREALAVEAPEAHRIAAEDLDVRDRHRVHPAPTGRCRAVRKSGIPEGTEMPAPVSATTERAPRTSSARRSTSARAGACAGTRLSLP